MNTGKIPFIPRIFLKRRYLTIILNILLRNHEMALCIHDFKGEETPIKITTDFTYLRFHGPNGQYFGTYSQKALKSWSKRIKKWLKQNLDVYIYFNNDVEANAIKNAKELKLLLEGQE